MKKIHTKFKVLFSSENKTKAENYLGKLKDSEGVSLYHRKFTGKSKARYYVREVVRQGSKG